MAESQVPDLKGQLQAMGREFLKDVRSTMNEVFFGAPDGPGEPGTPMVPTQMMVSQDLGFKADYNAMLDGYANAAPPPDKSQGMER